MANETNSTANEYGTCQDCGTPFEVADSYEQRGRYSQGVWVACPKCNPAPKVAVVNLTTALWEVYRPATGAVISKPVSAEMANTICERMSTDGEYYAARVYRGEPEFVSNVERARRVQIARCTDLLAEVTAKVEHIAGLQSPDWADVGDLSHIATELTELVMGWKGE